MNEPTFKTTDYFRESVLARRPELEALFPLIVKAINNPIFVEYETETNRYRHYIYRPTSNHYYRVILLADGETVHNVFPDRNFKRRMEE